MKVIKMDGDYYHATIPENIHMQTLRQCIILGIISEVDRDQFFIGCVGKAKDKSKRAIPAIGKNGEVIPPKKVVNIRLSASETVSTEDINAATKVSYRPMLIPVTKDGTFDHYISNNVPEGTIVHGGTLYADGKPVNFPSHRGEVLEFNGESLEIGDTSDNPNEVIEWFSVAGKLVCSRNIVNNITIAELSAQDLL